MKAVLGGKGKGKGDEKGVKGKGRNSEVLFKDGTANFHLLYIYTHTHNVLYILTPTLIGKELEKGKGGKAGMLGTNMDFLASVCCQCHECKTFASTGP